MRKNRLAGLVLALLLLILVLPINASANAAPYISYTYDFSLEELPQGAVYVDLLIPLEETDEFYVPLVERNLPDGMSPNAQIVTYCEGGYRSYSFHFQNASANIQVAPKNTVSFYVDEELLLRTGESDRLEELVEAEGTVRLAILDKEGNILQVSRELDLVRKQIFHSLSGNFIYNARTDSFEVEEMLMPWSLFFYIVLALIGMIFTVLSEYLVSIPFGLWKDEGKTIVLTNIISQLAMHLLYILLYGVLFWRYNQAVLLLEILIYAGEYLFYRRAFWVPNRKKALAFSLTANTVSLLIGVAAWAYVGTYF